MCSSRSAPELHTICGTCCREQGFEASQSMGQTVRRPHGRGACSAWSRARCVARSRSRASRVAGPAARVFLIVLVGTHVRSVDSSASAQAAALGRLRGSGQHEATSASAAS
eukprot:scaffold7906_cov118-Isochrysis_galbana.AAC.3